MFKPRKSRPKFCAENYACFITKISQGLCALLLNYYLLMSSNKLKSTRLFVDITVAIMQELVCLYGNSHILRLFVLFNRVFLNYLIHEKKCIKMTSNTPHSKTSYDAN